ncbi:hypothetical protein IAD21_04297 [Abditibacteriota bacterium]|nr:hypothetical protein IAD21_04297 [Abditibacteriota bacterium]
MTSPTHSNQQGHPSLPDPIKQPWEWAVVLASGDERAIAIQRQRQREGINLIKQRNEETHHTTPNDSWDILEALKETRLMAGRPPLFEADEEREATK